MLDAGAGPITADTVAARMHQLGFRTLAREPLIQSAFASGLRKLQSDARLVSARKQMQIIIPRLITWHSEGCLHADVDRDLPLRSDILEYGTLEGHSVSIRRPTSASPKYSLTLALTDAP